MDNQIKDVIPVLEIKDMSKSQREEMKKTKMHPKLVKILLELKHKVQEYKDNHQK